MPLVVDSHVTNQKSILAAIDEEIAVQLDVVGKRHGLEHAVAFNSTPSGNCLTILTPRRDA